MELSDYLRVLQRRWVIVAVATLLGVLAGFVTASDESEAPVTYTATQTLSVVQPTVSATAPLVSFTPSQLAVYATVGEVPVQAAEALDYEGTPQELASTITTEADDGIGVLRITASDLDGARAAEIANTFGRKLRTVIIGDAQRRIRIEIRLADEQVDDLQQQVNDLDGQIALNPTNVAVVTAQRDALINQYRIAYDELQALRERTAGGDPVVILESAVPSQADQGLSAPKSPPARMAMFGLLGLLLGAALALVLDRIDTRIRTKEDAEASTGLPVLAEIPFLPRRHRHELISATRPASPFAEAYRNLRSTLAFARGPIANEEEADEEDEEGPSRTPRGRIIDQEPSVILVTSSGPYEGKTTTIANLAASYAETGRSVLVLDCDFRRPRLHQVFGTRESPGLADTLEDPRRFRADHEIICATSIEGVRIVPAGTPTDNPARLFNRARSLMDASRRQADIVLVDTPPYLVANDAAELIPWVDAVVVVVKSRRTGRGAVERMIENMQRQQAPAVGVVLVGSDQADAGYSPYYYHRANARTDRARRQWRRALRMGSPKARRRDRKREQDQAEGDQARTDPMPVDASVDTAHTDEAVLEESLTDEAVLEESLTDEAVLEESLTDEAAGETPAEESEIARPADPALTGEAVVANGAPIADSPAEGPTTFGLDDDGQPDAPTGHADTDSPSDQAPDLAGTGDPETSPPVASRHQ